MGSESKIDVKYIDGLGFSWIIIDGDYRMLLPCRQIESVLGAPDGIKISTKAGDSIFVNDVIFSDLVGMLVKLTQEDEIF